ncbi:MAG TPA: glutamate racemase [Flavobacterium sp.]|nr:glutamate racemase [Flavobacterium sp.]
MNNDTRPIGLFDSGVGGTTIWSALHQLMPDENTIFLGDSANAPYGHKSKEMLVALSAKNINWLIENNAKLIIVACNTATTNAIEELRAMFNIPIIGIEPAIKPAALNTQTKKVGVLATKSTLGSRKYAEAQKHFPEVTFINQVGYKIVQLIEEGQLYSKELKELLKQYIFPMIDQQIDYLVLGCTHYPYLIPILQELLPDNIQIIDSGEAIAQQTKRILQTNDLLKTDGLPGTSLFYTNKNVETLQSFINGHGTAVKIDF